VLDIELLFSFSGAVVVLFCVTGLTVIETLAVLLVELSSFAVNVKLSDLVSLSKELSDPCLGEDVRANRSSYHHPHQ
jgi:hypothetical protein